MTCVPKDPWCAGGHVVRATAVFTHPVGLPTRRLLDIYRLGRFMLFDAILTIISIQWVWGAARAIFASMPCGHGSFCCGSNPGSQSRQTEETRGLSMYSGDVRIPYVRLKHDAGSRSQDHFEVEVKTVLWLAGILILWYLNDIADTVLRLLTPSSERGQD